MDEGSWRGPLKKNIKKKKKKKKRKKKKKVRGRRAHWTACIDTFMRAWVRAATGGVEDGRGARERERETRFKIDLEKKKCGATAAGYDRE